MGDSPAVQTTFEKEPLTLNNAARGAAHELFDDELQRVLANIQDVNTEATPTREINLKFKFKPSKSRNECAITVASTCKLAPQNTAEGSAFIGTFRGKPVATPNRPEEQQALFDAESKPRAVGAGESRPKAAAQ